MFLIQDGIVLTVQLTRRKSQLLHNGLLPPWQNLTINIVVEYSKYIFEEIIRTMTTIGVKC